MEKHTPDPFDLERFVVAQDRDGTYDQAVKELRAGRKRTHWIWYVLPQMRGLSVSPIAFHYGIGSRDEAVAYLAHDILGPRLDRCTQLILRSGAVTAVTLMGSDIDATKLKSSMTLFAEASDNNIGFVAVLRKYFQGGRDLKTLELLEEGELAAGSAPVMSQTRKRRRWRLGAP